MRKYLLSLAAILLIFLSAKTQMRVGILAGGHSSSIKETNDLPNWNSMKEHYEGRTGIHFGFLSDIPFSAKSSVSFQPGVIFFNKGRKYNESFDTSVSNIMQINKKEFINTVDIPLNFVYRFKLSSSSAIFIGAGPYLSFIYNGKLRSEIVSKDTIDFEDKLLYNISETADLPVGKGAGRYNGLDYGLNAIAGVEFGRVFLRAEGSMGINDVFEGAGYKVSEFKHQLFGASIGFYLGKPVSIEEKPRDRDKDGITDDKDSCPELAGPAITNGCPDKDADGIADKDDKCPDEAGPSTNAGCPVLDTDKDGVLDKDDECPTIAGVARYKGCPVPDTDKDGINDDEDKCPTIAGYGRYEGCPIPDTDGDGINDEVDKCPAVIGSKEKNGCPDEIKKEIIEKVNYAARRIQFKFTRSDLMPGSFAVLDEVVKILKDNPELNLSIEGHTSNDGIVAANMKLSQARAENVKSYLESKGIAAERLSAKGFGPSQPLNNGKTEAEKSQNRRVELKLSN